MNRGDGTSFRRNAVEVFATRVCVVFILFGTNVIVTRSLPTGDRGVYALAVALPLMLQNVAGLGLNQANVFFVNRDARVRDLVANSVWFSLVIGAVLLSLALVLRDQVLGSVLKGMSVTYFLLIVALMPLSFWDVFLNGIIQGLNMFRVFNTRRLLVSGLMLVLMVLTQLVLGWGLPGAIGALAITILVTGIWFFVITVRLDGFTGRPNLRLAKRTLLYGAKSYLATLTSFLSYRIDMFLLAALRTTREVAYYAIAVSLVELVWYIPDSIGVVLFPRLSASRDDRETHRITAAVCRVTLAITIVAVVLIALLGRPLIVLLFHRRYLPSVEPLLILLPGVLSIAVWKILWRNFSGRDRQQVTIVASSLALALNVALNLLLIPRWGISGAAASSAVSYTFGTAVLLWAFLHESGLSLRDTLVVTRADLHKQATWLRGGLAAFAAGRKAGV
jgi:O-antigen/teichoic acid export membrane protein